MNQLLITLGCSWMYGVGVGYTPEMTGDQYCEIAWQEPICDSLSFRGLLSKKYNLVNKNLSRPGSSNQWQFRRAKEYFTSEEFKQARQEFDKIIVMWGVTSTARNELYCISEKKLVNFFYKSDTPESRAMVKYFYDHDNEVTQLTTEMLFWNDYFSGINITNLWFDTFNHHDYNQTIDHLIFNDELPRDLLSKLAITNGLTQPDNRYHGSEWSIDSNRISHLIKCGLLNPHSHHPTQEGHRQIADFLTPYIET
jgi:hypothetical protein